MTTSTNSRPKTFWDNLLSGIAWPDSGLEWFENPKKPEFIFRLLNAISFNDYGVGQVSVDQISEEIGMKLGYYWDVAQTNMKANKFSPATRALRNILKIDPLNAAALNRLGIISAKRKRYSDSLYYFQKAIYIEPSAPGLHNLGLIYYETKDYKKSVHAFRMALHLDDSNSRRYIALAKANEMIGNEKKVQRALEAAAHIEKNKMTLTILYNFYKSRGMTVKEHEVRVELTQTSKTKIKIESEYNIESLKLSMEFA
jgi:tetratricopeptide (TPR) repeat protein